MITELEFYGKILDIDYDYYFEEATYDLPCSETENINSIEIDGCDFTDFILSIYSEDDLLYLIKEQNHNQ